MPIPVSTQPASAIYGTLRNATQAIMSIVAQTQIGLAAGNCNPVLILNLQANAQYALSLVAQLQATPTLMGAVLALYASETGDTTDTTGADVLASAAALQALCSAIVADFPKATDGHLHYQTFNSSGVATYDSFASAQFPTTSAAMTAWLATVS